MANFTISPAKPEEFEALVAIDGWPAKEEYKKKIETRPEQILVLKEDDEIVGVMRWAMFWDYIPYTCYLNVSDKCRGKGYAKKALMYWENKMQEEGWPMVMCSIPTDDGAQHFYRKMGYKECGCFTILEGPLKQAMEILFSKVFEQNENTKLGSIYK